MSITLLRIEEAETVAVKEIRQAVQDAVDHTIRGISGIPLLSLRAWLQEFDERITAAYPKLVATIAGKEFLTSKEKRKVPLFHKKKDDTDFLLLAFALGVLYVTGGYDSVQRVPNHIVDEYIKNYNKWPASYKDLLRHHRAMYITDIDKILNATRDHVRGALRNQIYGHANYPMITHADWQQRVEGFPFKVGEYIDGWVINAKASTQYRSTETLNHAVASAALLDHPAEVVVIYFDVQPDACESCVRAYLTNGRGSAPKRFSIEELLHNGTNEGVQRSRWRPVAGAMHPNCRCTMRVEYRTDQ